MKSAIIRLLAITFGTIILGIFILFALRFMGQSSRHASFDHVLLKDSFLIIAQGGATRSAPAATTAAYDKALEADPKIVLAAPLHMTMDGMWVVSHYNDLAEFTDQSGRINEMLWHDVQKADAGYLFSDEKGEHSYRGQDLKILTLSDFLQRYKDNRILLDIRVPHTDQVKGFLDQTKVLDQSPNVMVASPFSSVLREVRKERPLWIYLSDPASVTRLMMMSSLGLESLAGIDADIVASTPAIEDREVFTPAIRDEIERRNKKMILEINWGWDQLDKDLVEDLDGIRTDAPIQVLNYFSTKKSINN